MENTSVFDKDAALSLLDGEEELLKNLAVAFMNSPKRPNRETLHELCQKEDKTEAASYVHYTKGAARQLFLQKTAASAQILEDTLRGKAEGDIEALSDRFIADYKEAIEELKRYTKQE